MEFRSLGPLEVESEAGAVTVAGGKPRAVLAVLLLHAGEGVSPERLALALWGEEAPAGAARTIQVHVSRLRKALGDPQAVVTTPAGYCVRVGPDELDVARFERGVADGRRALEAGCGEEASAVLRDALALWRGPPLGEFAWAPFAPPAIDRLEELRLGALELRVEADLATARHAEVVAELQQLAAEPPWRECLHAQLMLALYRSGRQADALDAYRKARHVLVEERASSRGASCTTSTRRCSRTIPSLRLRTVLRVAGGARAAAARGAEPDDRAPRRSARSGRAALLRFRPPAHDEGTGRGGEEPPRTRGRASRRSGLRRRRMLRLAGGRGPAAGRGTGHRDGARHHPVRRRVARTGGRALPRRQAPCCWRSTTASTFPAPRASSAGCPRRVPRSPCSRPAARRSPCRPSTSSPSGP